MATPKNQKSGKNSQPPIELEPAPAAHVELVGILNEVTVDTRQWQQQKAVSAGQCNERF